MPASVHVVFSPIATSFNPYAHVFGALLGMFLSSA
jgi:hypothetical protein